MARNHSTVYVGNLSEKVTEDLLHELFLQAGPVASINIPSDRGRPKPFGFVQFKHPCSVHYAIQLLDGISMFGKSLRLNLPKGFIPPGMSSMGGPGMPPMGGPGMPSMGLPGMPPMGLPVVPRMDLQPKPLIHPLSHHGRHGPPVKSRSYGRRDDDDDNDRDKSRDHNRTRRRDDMMPSSRPKKNRHDFEDTPEFDIDSIPDLLDSFGPPIPSQGLSRSSHGPSNHHRRDHQPYDNRSSGSHRPHHDSRRDRHSSHHSSNRRHF